MLNITVSFSENAGLTEILHYTPVHKKFLEKYFHVAKLLILQRFYTLRHDNPALDLSLLLQVSRFRPIHRTKDDCMTLHRSPKFDYVALADTREHPLALRLSKQYSMPPFAQVPRKLLRPAGLLSLSQQIVFDVVPVKDRYYCLNHLRLYALVKQLSPQTLLCVRLCLRLKEEEIAQRILQDLLISPVLSGLPRRDWPRLAHLWEQLRTQLVFTGLFFKTGSAGLEGLLRTRFRPSRGNAHA